MVKTRKLDIYNLNDRAQIEKLTCPFCGEPQLNFRASDGYESHFADSYFICTNCSCDYPIGLLFAKSLEECKEMLKRRAKGYYAQIKKEYLEKSEKIRRLKEKIDLYDANFNPSKREELEK